jgi:hypothetical protein
MFLNENHHFHDRHNTQQHQTQGNIVRFLRSLVLSKSSPAKPKNHKNKNNRVFGRDLKLHLTETKQEGILQIKPNKILELSLTKGFFTVLIKTKQGKWQRGRQRYHIMTLGVISRVDLFSPFERLLLTFYAILCHMHCTITRQVIKTVKSQCSIYYSNYGKMIY